MVDPIEAYKNLLQRGADVYEQLLQIYAPDRQAENDWADVTLAETRTKRNGLLERLADPTKVSAAYTSTLISSIGHYLDSHWADYREIPVANPENRKQIEQQHAELEAIIQGVAQLSLALK